MIVWNSVKPDELVNDISDVFASFGSLLTLSQSPFAIPDIIESALILDDQNQSQDDRGLALQIVFRWSVLSLAPTPIESSLSHRPFDDPTWANPLWWRFNIMHHLYVDPLHPDQFFQDQKRVNSLINLMGVSSTDAFYDERKRALREIAERIIWLANHEGVVDAIGRMMAETLTEPLSHQSRTLLGEASFFQNSFRFGWLTEITTLTMEDCEKAWNNLRKRRLIESKSDSSFYVPQRLRGYLSEGLTPFDKSHHVQVAQFYCQDGNSLSAAWHFQEAGHKHEAASTVLGEIDQGFQSSETDSLVQVLQKFERSHVSDEVWGEIQSYLGRVLQTIGDTDGAINATRQALQVTSDPTKKTELYIQLGKLHEDQMPELALTYYTHADQMCPDNHPLRSKLLKDRAWLHLNREAWVSAETDLITAQTLATTQSQKADISDAFAELHRRQTNIEKALTYAHKALIYREESGDILAVAKSYNTLGMLYGTANEPSKALAAHTKSLSIFQKIGNDESAAKAFGNIAVDYYYLEKFDDALKSYLAALDIFDKLGLVVQVGLTHYNVVEVLIELGRVPEAQHYLEKGFSHCDTHNLQAIKNHLIQISKTIPQPDKASFALKPAHRLALDLTHNNQRLTRKSFIEASKKDQRFDKPLTADTAKRRLADLVDNGILQKHGKGSGTYYTQSL